MITIREIADDNSSISSTRWAFGTIIKYDMIIILLTIGAYLAGHFLKRPFDNNLFNGVALLLGLLTALITTSKALQGFEPKHKSCECKEEEKTEEVIVEEKQS
jgi:hypothetical protein